MSKSNVHVYDVKNGRLLAEFVNTIQAVQAIEDGCVEGIVDDQSYLIVTVHKHVRAKMKIEFIDLTEEFLNKVNGTNVINSPKEEVKKSTSSDTLRDKLTETVLTGVVNKSSINVEAKNDTFTDSRQVEDVSKVVGPTEIEEENFEAPIPEDYNVRVKKDLEFK